MTSAPSSVPDIPARYLVLYRDAAARHRLGADGWSYLAGVGKVECDHGRSQLPGCHSGSNYAGAQGPAQFLASTWAMYGVDGDGDGRRDVYDPVDAIPGMARYLRASGAPADWRRALFAYNHDTAYVARVLQIAAGYRAAAAQPAPIAGHVLAGEGTWLAPIPGFPGERCDARIVPDVVALSRRRSYYPLLTTRN
ncbi:MAG TPA: lytic transglycosylase domain-containing protein [Solirubrobacteraceae bacterium]